MKKIHKSLPILLGFALVGLIIFITIRERSASKQIMNINTSKVKDMTSTQSDSLLIVDVREPFEYEAGHIPGSILIPLGDIPTFLNNLPKNKTILVVCRSGRRSLEAARLLAENGFEEVLNYEGGMLEWDGNIEYGL
ncbi:MAG: rhodanese-like domain-containing protein [Firmicutes bacterium]|nr:rhodanese-like domain-containing protein [Bacillota bacterium]MDD4263632.1 rhodanese-like domain-containing protein [Bacillota bacterium]MDD4692990.1 rhodanese-like domain-containing protein [Bacillota bacterium]